MLLNYSARSSAARIASSLSMKIRGTCSWLGRFDGQKNFCRSAKYSLAAQFELRRRIRQDKLDVFHTPFYMMPLAAGCPWWLRCMT